MVSTVRTRPSHYEVLGLTPTATGEEIARAFARETGPFQPRPLGGIAQVVSAYETLRDPGKRRAYDESLGVKPGPRPDSSPTAAVLRGWAGIIGSAPAAAGDPAADDRSAEDRPAPPAADIEAVARPEAAPERQPGAIYGAGRREPVRPAAPEPSPAPGSQAQPRPRPPEAAEPGLEPWIADFVAMHRATADRSPDGGELPSEWKRPGLAIGGLFLAVGLLGGLTGWWTANDIAPQPPESGAMLGLPVAEARPTTRARSPAPPPARVEEVAPERPRPAAVALARTQRAPAPVQSPVVPEREQAETSQVAESASQPIETGEPAVEQAGAEAPPAPAVAATLPLPNRVIARTIERIGYACGQVASTAPVEGGAPGVFKVTCTSGQSYQARPVRGRYRFRRWGSD